jgi:6-methylsalicylate decarboxylase
MTDGSATVDVHAHCTLAALDAFIERHQLSSIRPSGYVTPAPVSDSPGDIAERIELMDEAEVRVQVLSPLPMAALSDCAAAVERARLVNERYAELASDYPGRLSAYVSLPIPHVDESLEEMRRGLDELGMAGVTMLCSALGRSIAEEAFDPLFTEMDGRGTVLFLHPAVNGLCSPLVADYGLAPSVGTLMEDAAVALQLIVRRVPERYPGVKVIVPHLGGLLPMALRRIDNQLPITHPGLPEPPSVTARRFWYDAVNHGSAAALRCACEGLGAERILAGSDFPALSPFESYSETVNYVRDCGLPADDVTRILSGNASLLFAGTL